MFDLIKRKIQFIVILKLPCRVNISQLFHLTVVLRNKETTFIRSRSVNDIANKR